MPTEFEDVLRFWFPQQLSGDYAAMARQLEWWFRGGAHSTIIERFSSLLERAARGELDHWSHGPRCAEWDARRKGPPEIGKSTLDFYPRHRQ